MDNNEGDPTSVSGEWRGDGILREEKVEELGDGSPNVSDVDLPVFRRLAASGIVVGYRLDQSN